MNRLSSWITFLVWLSLKLVTKSRLALCDTIDDEVKTEYWRNLGQETLEASLKIKRIENVAKNVIFFLGDGMGIPTVTAMRIYKGQKKGKRGEEEKLTFDKFPFVSLAKTYALDKQNPDSANTATAYFCGVKANYGTLGVDGRVARYDCQASLDKTTHVSSVLQWAQEAGKRTGLVTTNHVTDATPAGLYAHAANRQWEGSSPDSRCDDIAKQLIRNTPGKDIHVILGGGRKMFLPSSATDIDGMAGGRNDSLDLLKEWLETKKQKGLKAQSVFDYKSFHDVNPNDVDYLLGLFNSTNLPYVVDRPDVPVKPPTLVEMTEKAIRILNKGPEGFFLAVEGGEIDLGHHENAPQKALEEGVEFDSAIATALKMIDPENTLILVTADHSHTMTISGNYPARGSNILGLGGTSEVDKMMMTILSYANGPGYKGSRENLTESQVAQKNYQYDATYPMLYETHGAEDVAVYALGPMAHLFHGVHDQSYIPYVVGYASCVGPNKEHCKKAAFSNPFIESNEGNFASIKEPQCRVFVFMLSVMLYTII